MENVLIIHVDQLRRDVLSCYGGKEVQTPNIDFLAENGVLLENFYTPSAVCTPSRGCFFTGNYPHENGAYRNGIPVKRDVHGFAEVFAKAGYHTGYLGKWHLADHKERGDDLGEYNPLGFEDWDYKVEFGHCKSVAYENGKVRPKREVGNDKSYTTDWLTDETIRFLNNQLKSTQPFLFTVSIPDPHQPFEVRPPYDTMFDPLKVEIPESFWEKEIPDWAERDTWGRLHYYPYGLFEREGHLRRLKAQYLGAVKCIDDNVGRIIQCLKDTGLWENTMVVFTTDHGVYMGEHGLMEKNNLYESVYHIPCVISMPWKKIQERRCNTWINVVDFAPTLAGMLGIPYPFKVQGKDLSTYLLENRETEQILYIHPSDVPRAGILTPEFELAYVGKGWCEEEFHDHILFDMRKDPLQMTNVFGKPEYAKVQKMLTEKLKRHFEEIGTPKKFLPKEVWTVEEKDGN